MKSGSLHRHHPHHHQIGADHDDRRRERNGLFPNLTPHDALPPHIIRCVVLSDTHGQHDRLPPLPDGDVLIHLGDAAEKGSLDDIRSFARYLRRQQHEFHPSNIVFVQGNHDRDRRDPFYINLRAELEGAATVIMDEVVTIDIPHKMPLRVFGASWDSCARDLFSVGSAIDNALNEETMKINLDRFGGMLEEELAENIFGRRGMQGMTTSRTALYAHSENIADGGFESTSISPVDMFLTHSPPFVHHATRNGWYEGSHRMSRMVDRHGIPVHLCGHVHHGRGVQLHDNRKAVCVNCATSHRNRPVVIDYDANQHCVVNVEL